MEWLKTIPAAMPRVVMGQEISEENKITARWDVALLEGKDFTIYLFETLF